MVVARVGEPTARRRVGCSVLRHTNRMGWGAAFESLRVLDAWAACIVESSAEFTGWLALLLRCVGCLRVWNCASVAESRARRQSARALMARQKRRSSSFSRQMPPQNSVGPARNFPPLRATPSIAFLPKDIVRGALPLSPLKIRHRIAEYRLTEELLAKMLAKDRASHKPEPAP